MIKSRQSCSYSFVENCPRTPLTLRRGRYFVEGWGASGGGFNSTYKGKGAYVSAILNLRNEQTFFITLGGEGETCPHQAYGIYKGGCNGGGNGGV